MITQRDISTPLERITWRDGQGLASRDLRDDASNTDRYRRLHVRYLHRTWGVVEGLRVLALAGDAFVTAGYALDNEGRELLVPQLTAAPPPKLAVSATMYLVISSGESCGCGGSPDLATLCPGAANPVAIEKGALAWKLLGEVRLGHDVLLARALVSGGKIDGAVDSSIRRQAATLQQPRIWFDTTVPGQTGWSDVEGKILRVIQVTMDASDAGFLSTPVYIAQLTGTAEIAAQYISSAAATGFTFVVTMQPPFPGSATPNAGQAESSGWTVSWFAVEQQG